MGSDRLPGHWAFDDPEMERDIGEIVQVLSTKHDISLPADDPLLVMPRMNAIVGKRLVQLLENAQSRAEERLVHKVEAIIDRVRERVAQDATKASSALGNQAEELSRAAHREIELKVDGTLSYHFGQLSRAVCDAVTEHDHWQQCAFAAGLAAILVTLCLCTYTITNALEMRHEEQTLAIVTAMHRVCAETAQEARRPLRQEPPQPPRAQPPKSPARPKAPVKKKRAAAVRPAPSLTDHHANPQELSDLLRAQQGP